MEETYLTVKELAELKGCTERYITSLIAKSKLNAIEVLGIGGKSGVQYKIPLLSLDNKLQIKFKRRLKRVQKSDENLKIKDTKMSKKEFNIEKLTEKERQKIVFWKKILESWNKYRLDGSKEDADKEFLKLINIQYSLNLNRRTLYRKWKAFNDEGEIALIDGRGKHNNHSKKMTSEIWDIFEYYYLDQNKKSVKLCMTLTELNLKNMGVEIELPSLSTFKRAVKKIPIPYIKYFREGEKTFIGECSPYIKRMYDDLESNDIWVADNHTFDVMIQKGGKSVRVYLTAFMDVRSRKMTGWCVTDNPSSDATIYALKKGCEFNGVPKKIYTDNGREFLFHDLGGNGFRKRKKGEELKLPSILDDLGIEFQTAIPKNARAKGIERAFYTVKETFSKLFEGYTGGTILERPDKLKTLVKFPEKLVSIQDFINFVDTYIVGWYNKQSHMGTGMNGKCPDEVFVENLIEKRIIPKDKLNLMFMRYAKGNKGTLKVGKNGVTLTFYGKELQYWSEDLWKTYFGKDVYIRYNPDDLNSIRIYDIEQKFLCIANLKTELSYKATKEEIKAQQRENRSAIKAVAAYKKKKNIEAENELKLVLDKALENSKDIVSINTNVIRPIFNTEIKKAVGYDDEDIVIDWSIGLERLRKVKEESQQW